MQNFIIFLGHQWVAVLIFVILLAVLIWLETQGKVGGLKRLKPQQVIHMINKDAAVLIDTRDKSTFNKGHIAGAKNMLASDLENKNLDKYKDKDVILVCSNGLNAPKLGNKLKKQGLTNLYFLQGGINAWSNENLPLVKKK